MADLVTCLWYDHGEARKAASSTPRRFPTAMSEGVNAAPGDFPGGSEGSELTVEFTVLGRRFVGLNGGPNFKPNEAVSFMVVTETRRRPTATGTRSSATAAQESACGWCKDRWGFSWQITPRRAARADDRVADPARRQARLRRDDDDVKIDIAAIEAAAEGG